MYAVLCATPEEELAILGHPSFGAGVTPAPLGPFQVHEPAYGNFIFARSGIGKINAAALTAALCTAFPIEGIVFSGVAGSLNPDLDIGDVVFGKSMAVVDYGLYRDGRLGRTQYGTLPTSSPPLVVQPSLTSTEEALFEQVAARFNFQERPGALGRSAILGTILTADYFLNCSAHKQTLRDQHLGDAIDMETAAVYLTAQAFGVPLYAVRTISDHADNASHMDYSELAAIVAANSAFCVFELLELLRKNPKN